MKIRMFLLGFLIATPFLGAEMRAQEEASLCHGFVDYDFIWTLEVVKTRDETTPIVNVITLGGGEWEVTPEEFQVIDSQGRSRDIETFSFESGDPEEPFRTPYLKIRGGDFAGFDLIGDFEDLDTVRRVSVEMEKDRIILEPMDCEAFDELLDKISRVEIGGDNVIASFQVLNIQLLGDREIK